MPFERAYLDIRARFCREAYPRLFGVTVEQLFKAACPTGGGIDTSLGRRVP